MRLGILASHPIQYQAPWFRALAKKVDLEVFFAHRQTAAGQSQAGFGVAFDWDVDLLSGYKHQLLQNVSPHPDVNSYAGCDTPGIADVIRREKFDAFLVMGWYLKSYLQATQASRALGVPILVRGDSQLRTPRPLLKRLALEVRQRWLLRRFDGFLSVGQRHQEYLEHFGVPYSRIFFVPHFVDNDWFARQSREASGRRMEVRRQWEVQARELVVMFVGKFIAKKRPGDLLRAVAKAQSNSMPFRVVLVGAGELENELRTLAVQEKLAVHFAGFKNQSELPECYAAADVLVLPSDGGETWGLVVNEAMTCGIPAIVSEDAGCAPDLIDDGETGFTFSLGDIRGLADRLLQVGKMIASGHDFTPALRAKMQKYSLETGVAGTLQALSALRGARE